MKLRPGDRIVVERRAVYDRTQPSAERITVKTVLDVDGRVVLLKGMDRLFVLSGTDARGYTLFDDGGVRGRPLKYAIVEKIDREEHQGR